MCVSGVAVAEAHLPHHLLGVVRPALGERVADEQAADDRRIAVGVQELQEVARPHLVHRREQQVRLARAGSRAAPSASTPDRAARCSRSPAALLVRARDVDVGEVRAVVRRRFVDERLFGARDRGHAGVLHELS